MYWIQYHRFPNQSQKFAPLVAPLSLKYMIVLCNFVISLPSLPCQVCSVLLSGIPFYTTLYTSQHVYDRIFHFGLIWFANYFSLWHFNIRCHMISKNILLRKLFCHKISGSEILWQKYIHGNTDVETYQTCVLLSQS